MTNKNYILVFILCVIALDGYNQEWKNIKEYQNQTGNQSLKEGHWLKKDRKRNSSSWLAANEFNIAQEKMYLKYTTILQKRDFYRWFDKELKRKKHEVNWVGIAAIAANNLAKLNNDWVKMFVINDRELISFAKHGSEQVFKFAIPELQQLYFSKKIYKGTEAEEWDRKYGKIEQCDILNQAYLELSDKSMRKLKRMAEGKWIYRFAIHRDLRFEGELKNCNARYEYSINRLVPYYLKHTKN